MKILYSIITASLVFTSVNMKNVSNEKSAESKFSFCYTSDGKEFAKPMILNEGKYVAEIILKNQDPCYILDNETNDIYGGDYLFQEYCFAKSSHNFKATLSALFHVEFNFKADKKEDSKIYTYRKITDSVSDIARIYSFSDEYKGYAADNAQTQVYGYDYLGNSFFVNCADPIIIHATNENTCYFNYYDLPSTITAIGFKQTKKNNKDEYEETGAKTELKSITEIRTYSIYTLRLASSKKEEIVTEFKALENKYRSAKIGSVVLDGLCMDAKNYINGYNQMKEITENFFKTSFDSSAFSFNDKLEDYTCRINNNDNSQKINCLEKYNKMLKNYDPNYQSVDKQNENMKYTIILFVAFAISGVLVIFILFMIFYYKGKKEVL